MSIVRLVAGAVVVWGLTHLIYEGNGMFGFVGRMRRITRRVSLSGALDCFLCVSLWVAAPVGYMMGSSYVEVVVLVLGFSAVTMLVDRAAGHSERGTLVLEQAYEERFEAEFRGLKRSA